MSDEKSIFDSFQEMVTGEPSVRPVEVPTNVSGNGMHGKEEGNVCLMGTQNVTCMEN